MTGFIIFCQNLYQHFSFKLGQKDWNIFVNDPMVHFNVNYYDNSYHWISSKKLWKFNKLSFKVFASDREMANKQSFVFFLKLFDHRPKCVDIEVVFFCVLIEQIFGLFHYHKFWLIKRTISSHALSDDDSSLFFPKYSVAFFEKK